MSNANDKVVKHLGNASLALSDAMHEACQNKDFALSDEILEIIRLSERLEVRLSGQPIYRKEIKNGSKGR